MISKKKIEELEMLIYNLLSQKKDVYVTCFSLVNKNIYEFKFDLLRAIADLGGIIW